MFFVCLFKEAFEYPQLHEIRGFASSSLVSVLVLAVSRQQTALRMRVGIQLGNALTPSVSLSAVSVSTSER